MTLYRDILQASAKGAADKVRDVRLCGEITGLVMRNGRIDHKASGNDDTVISWLLGHWLLAEGRNLECYGLNPSENLSMMISKEAYSDPQEIANIRRRQWVRQEIERLLVVLRDSTDGKEIARTEHALKLLSETTYRDGGEVFSMDALKRQSEEIRRNKAYQQAMQNRGNADASAFDRPWYLAA